MKKIMKYMAVVMSLLMILASCGENDIYTNNPTNPGGGDEDDITMTDKSISGTVKDIDGNALEGVSVVSGTASATTSATGFFVLEETNYVYEHLVVTFEKPGYFPVTKSFIAKDNGDEYTGEVVMVAKGESSHTTSVTFNSTQGKTVKTGGLTINFPANGFKNAANGKPYSGTVKVDVLHLSPDNNQFYELMPGDLTALDANHQPMALISYGMANVVMTDTKGNALQLADGSEASIRFEIPEEMKDAPEEIPLWSFDNSLGLWKEELTATRQPDGSYAGKATHFSWINIDEKEEMAYIRGYVRNELGLPMKNIRVTINGFKHAYTDNYGEFMEIVPCNRAFHVTVLSKDYGNYTPVADVEVAPLPGAAIKEITLILPVRHKIFGRIHDANEDPVQTTYDIELDQETVATDLINRKDGTYDYYLPWNFEGEGKITVRGPKGEKIAKPFTVPADTDVEVNVSVGQTSGVDEPDITAECPGEDIHMLKVTRPGNATFGGVIIEDNRLMVMTNMMDEPESDGGNLLMIHVTGYSPDKSEYDNALVQAIDGNKAVYAPSGKLQITRAGDVFYFDFKGEGFYMNYNNSGQPKEGVIKVHHVDILHLFTAETRANYTPTSPIPGFCPRLSTPAPLATVITESTKLGTGGMLYYNGTDSDFKALCGQANGRKDLKRIEYEFNESYGEAAYQGDKKVVMIEFDSDMEEISRETAEYALENGMFVPRDITDNEEELGPIDAQLFVTALQGGTLSIFDLDDYSYSNATYAENPLVHKVRNAKSLLRKALQR